MPTNRMRKVPCGLLWALGILLAVPTARADEYQDQMSRGQSLAVSQDYRGALKAFQAAYAVRQNPAILIYIARSHLQLGEGNEALNTYRRFVVAVPGAEPALRQEADQQIARLSALLEPPQPQPYSGQGFSTAAPMLTPQQFAMYLSATTENSERARIKRRNTGLMAGGAVLFGTSYMAAFLTGTLLLGDNRSYTYCNSSYGAASDESRCKAATGFLLIPGIGPIIGGLITPSVYWSIPWIFIDGAAQLGGLAMMIVAGRSNHALSKKSGIANLSIVPHATATSSGLTVAGRF